MNKFQAISKTAEIHVNRILLAFNKTKESFPVSEKFIREMSENNLLLIELLIARFSKLQDLLGAKLIDAFLEEKQENIEQLTMIDKLNKLERLGIIDSIEIWKNMREVRNHLTHEYPDHPELMAKYLNQLFELTPKLLNIFYKMKQK